MAPKFLFMHALLAFSLSFHGISSADIKYKVINTIPKTPTGIRFTKEIGIPYTQELLPKITNYIWSTVFQQNNPSERKPFDTIEVFIVGRLNGDGVVGQAVGNKITMAYDSILGFEGDVKWFYTSTMYHEMTHILQWNGEGKCPGNLTEGIAEYTQVKSKYITPGYTKPGEGNSWDEGYAFTARFLEYCDGLVPGFVAKFNKKLRKTYDVSFFKELTGKSVEQLWKEYKAKYRKNN